MKIGFVVDDSIYRFGGVQYILLNNATWFADNGHEVVILTGENKNAQPRPLHPKIKVIEIAHGIDLKRFSIIGNFAPFPGIASRKYIRNVLREEKFDVLQYHYPFSPFISGRILSETKKLPPEKQPKNIVVFQVHVEEKKVAVLLNHLLPYSMPRALKVVDTYLNISTPSRLYGEKYLKVKSHTIPAGLVKHQEVIKPKHNGKLNILFMGRHEERKGVLDLIEALNILSKKIDLKNKLEITIAGDGPHKVTAEEKAQAYNLVVHFPGRVSDQEKNNLYRQADIAVFPAKFGESMGLVLLEAMNFGCSIIAYGNPGYTDTLGPYADQTSVEIGNIPALAQKLEDFMSNKNELVYQLGADLRSYFASKYDQDIIGRQLLAEYHRKAAG